MEMDEGQAVAHLVLGILGNFASGAFFISSVPTVYRIVKEKSSGGLSGDLYIFKLLNCALWAFYGLPLVHPNDFWVLLTNAFGCVFSLGYIVSYMYSCSKSEQWNLVWKLCAVVSGMALVVVIMLVIEHNQYKRILVIGILCVIVSICMHLALLSQLREAMQFKDTKYLQPISSTAAFFKGLVWTAYAIVNFDIFIVIPNAVGIVIGCVQLMLAVGIYGMTWRQSEEGGKGLCHRLDIKSDIVSDNVINHVTTSRRRASGSAYETIGQITRTLSAQSGIIVPLNDQIPLYHILDIKSNTISNDDINHVMTTSRRRASSSTYETSGHTNYTLFAQCGIIISPNDQKPL